MIIKQIAFKRTFNLGNHENIAVELVAEVQPYETVSEVLDNLEQQAVEWKALRTTRGKG